MNINWQPSHLISNKIQLLPLTSEHFDSLYEIASDPLVWEQHPEKNRFEKDVFAQFFENGLQTGSAFTIVDFESNRIIGSSRYYEYNPDKSSVAIGYTFLGRAYWGGVYNKAVKWLMINYAFQYVDKIFFHVGKKNIRSQMAVIKLGAEFVNTVEVTRSNTVTSLNVYVLNKEKWNQ